jgi:predicted RNase H-like nuclease
MLPQRQDGDAGRNGVYAGLDGCREGWFCVELACNDAWAVSILPVDGVGRLAQSAKTILIDIPIGLLDSGPEERACDREARRLLTPKRGSSVFPVTARGTLCATSYPEAAEINRRLTGRGISQQCWAIVPKIKAIDDLLQRDAKLRGVLRECHPEICFWAFNARRPMVHNKKTPAGRDERMAVLRRIFPAADALLARAATRYSRAQAALDDIIDATVAAVTAKRGAGDYRTLPARPPRDAAGLPMEMVYCLSRSTAGGDRKRGSRIVIR